MSEELSTLGRNIHVILFDKKMSRQELADKVGVSQQMVSDIIHAKKSPKAETLIKIAKALGVKVDDLIK